MILLGLIGKSLKHSFSKQYFVEKFVKEDLKNISYCNFEIADVRDFPGIIKNNPHILGLNVTIPYKESIIPYLSRLDKSAEEVGAVNVIKITENKELIGYNTDVYGFVVSLKNILSESQSKVKAIILGSGGASKAVQVSLEQLDISYKVVSRTTKSGQVLTYQALTKELIQAHKLIVNTTPLGTYPNTENCPPIPYEYLLPSHILHDLVYNPSETSFMKMGKKKGAKVKNGLEMLQAQAKKSWEIWNEKG